MKKARLSLFVVLILALTLIMPYADNTIPANSTTSDSQLQQRLDQMEKEISAIENSELSKAQREIENIKNQGKLTENNKKDIESKYNKIIKSETDKILKKNGFDKVSADEDISSNQYTSSNDITLTDSLYYDSVNNLYRFTGDWCFSSYDSMMDIEDFAGVRMTNSTGYYIYSSYAKTFNQFGTETGYVDNQGIHSPSNSYITKRFQDSVGTCYNVIDADIDAGDMHIWQAYSGRITQYIKKTTGGINQIFLDYAHNYKSWILAGGAQISNVGFTGVNCQLVVTYNAVSGNWQRCSGGETIQ